MQHSFIAMRIIQKDFILSSSLILQYQHPGIADKVVLCVREIAAVKRISEIVFYPYNSCLLFTISSSSTARDFPFNAAALVAALKRRWSIGEEGSSERRRLEISVNPPFQLSTLV